MTNPKKHSFRKSAEAEPAEPEKANNCSDPMAEEIFGGPIPTGGGPVPPIRCAHTEVWSIEKLLSRLNPKNPNKHPEQQLRLYGKIIENTGWRRAVVVSKRSGLITKGHGAVQAAAMKGFTAAPVDLQDYDSDEAELADLLADNLLADLSDIDKNELKKLQKELESADFDIELAAIIAQIEEASAGQPTYPVCAKLNERHDFVLIYVENETDFVFLQTLCGVRTESSYKKSGIGIGRAVPFKRFLESLRENNHSLNVQSGHHDDAQASAEGDRQCAGIAKE